MKLSNVKAAKATVAKGITLGLLAGAIALAAPAKAEAQRIAVVVPVGYSHEVYVRHDRYDHLRFEQERRRDERIRAREYDRFHHDDHRGRW